MIIILLLESFFFYTSGSWLSFTGVWVATSLLKSPVLFSAFWPILMLLSGWSSLVLWFLSFPVLLPSLWGLFRALQLQLVFPSLSCSIFFCSLARSTCPSLLLISLRYRFIGLVGTQCSPVVRETWVQSHVASIQRLLKWHLILPSLTLSDIRYVSRVKWSNPGKELRPPLHLSVVAIEKGAFRSPSTTVANYYINLQDLFYAKTILVEEQ